MRMSRSPLSAGDQRSTGGRLVSSACALCSASASDSSDGMTAPSATGRALLAALPAITHANADIDKEIDEIVLVLDQALVERRLHQRRGAVGQRPGGTDMVDRRHVLEVTLLDARLDDAGQVDKIGVTDLVQLFHQLGNGLFLDDLLLKAVKQLVALRIRDAETEVLARQRFLVVRFADALEDIGQLFLVAQHQQQVDFVLGFEMLVDRTLADADLVGNHLDGDAILALLKKKLQGNIKNFAFALTKLLHPACRFFQI